MISKYRTVYLPAIFGTALEYYDIALYGYLAPVLIHVFLPQIPTMTAYFYFFLFELFAVISQLIGANFFGRLGDSKGRKPAMLFAMIGTALASGVVALLPTYSDIGLLAPALFGLCRVVQLFFLGGEFNGGAIYCLEHESVASKQGWVSGVYCAAIVSGILMATVVAAMVSRAGPSYFRAAYALSFCFAVVAYFWRNRLIETPEYVAIQGMPEPVTKVSTIRQKAFTLIVVSVFFGILSGLPTRIFNALLPLITGIDVNTMMTINAGVTVVYLGLLLWVGYLSDRLGLKKLMRAACLGTLVLSYPLMYLILQGSVWQIIMVKLIFALLLALLVAPFHAWSKTLFDPYHRYRRVSTAYSLGKVISTVVIASSILLYDKTHSIHWITGLLCVSACISWFALRSKSA
ncbi:MAG: MFS transporter [Pseudomonadota bacterium]